MMENVHEELHISPRRGVPVSASERRLTREVEPDVRWILFMPSELLRQKLEFAKRFAQWYCRNLWLNVYVRVT